MTAEKTLEAIEVGAARLVELCKQAHGEHRISTKLVFILELPNGTGTSAVHENGVLEENPVKAGRIIDDARHQTVMYNFDKRDEELEPVTALRTASRR